MREEDDLDVLLDSALRTYADPAPGLDKRVLARLAETQTAAALSKMAASRRRRWLPWAIALPLAAALAFLFLWLPKTHTPPPSHARIAANSQRPAIAAVSAEPSKATPAAASRRSVNRIHAHAHSGSQMAHANVLPKQDIFPTPQPLTPEEQAFALFAVQGSAPERDAIIEAREKFDTPLTIAAIRIPPLESSAHSAN